MVKTIIIAFVFLIASAPCFSQIDSQENVKAINQLKMMPQESVFVHYNTGLLFAGEQLLYKMYCFNDESKSLSEISKIGYVELIAKDKTVVFKHKVRLENGLGNGDFSLPTTLATGSYKLFAYTQWMQNKDIEYFFEADIAIINPYQKAADEYLETEHNTLANDSLSNNTMQQENAVVDNDPDQILNVNKTKIGKREKLTVTINSQNDFSGHYSVSVRKVNELINNETAHITRFFEQYTSLPKKDAKTNQNLFFLPELRGELLSGFITDKENSTPVVNEKVAVSFPGQNYLFKVSTTGNDGRFYFNLDTPYDNSSVIIQQLSDNWNNRSISFDSNEVTYEGVEFRPFRLSTDMKQQIKERSIQNQLENAYVNLKLDEILSIHQEDPFYRKFQTVYDLDDYTRFNTIKETTVEVIKTVSVKKAEDGNRNFYITPKPGFEDVGFATLLFVDGVFIKNQENFMDYSARKIKTFRISRGKFLIGSLFYQGILSITTVDGDFDETYISDDIEKIDLFEPQKKKRYFKQDYGAETNNKWDRIPDFRRQLLWIPSIFLENSEEVEIYTSDIAGEYKISLEGFSDKGVPISVSKNILVE